MSGASGGYRHDAVSHATVDAHPRNRLIGQLTANARDVLDGWEPFARDTARAPVAYDVLPDWLASFGSQQFGQFPDAASGLDGQVKRRRGRGFSAGDGVHVMIESRNVMNDNTLRVRQREARAKNERMTFKDNLKRARKAAKLTQEQLAHAIGAAGQSRIANYESGQREPTLGEIVALSAALGLSPTELVGWAKTPTEPLTKPSPLDATPSHFGRPNPATMLAAVDLLAFDEEQAGPYTVKGRTRRLLELYDRVTADGGEELSKDSNRQFDDEVRERAGKQGAQTHGRGMGSGKRKLRE